MTDDGFAGGIGDRRLVATATLLSLLAPGLGHFYLGRWSRGAVWAAGTLGVFVAVASDAVLGATITGGTGLLLGSGTTELVMLGLGAFAVGARVFGAVDAWIAVRRRTREGVVRCSSCERDVDADLSFCHYCLDDER
ncbi:zinc ribbon domain-containing protein [Halorubellus sp. JP-L1]|uniref:zinc ribbon domain-containing protein n=1 Tax=Halorubellus sp. JP-L1 TaxID=2715753 RepID=UPI00140CF1BD|nr:zinc ribbon domain-containing protein [Halorubellus sp. JP-L1]NHN40414.1 zinc ribbon domain-containing protein [Halorubellus sp. JP-L1]